ncbi:SDR family oxidoreductase [Mycobacteroides abscessus]|uniref:SDR family oxidoreductase n=1 Tax=Mycobacteroides abscessus TaxID=36809 RepID=UPI0019CFAFC1|nr:SDR family oxidoreductase [Mycobacteroides abscessus]MBN7439407.1 SDR family oxidoreductase [Mycobacteroides abscessus subsp. abscessus]MDM1884477.1 SDR family oxidoreductase [Mycobacteroides abscessus]MDM1890057.1 SDR family oxidoreductase [Mycobacteroides abscessus]MDO3106804.1 SDR family oxidoreductase [Mycobacteroides abscessus subsp. abscessus]
MTLTTERDGVTNGGMTEHVVRNGDIDVAYFMQGNPEGETILLVHGWPDSHHLWDGVAPLLRDRFRLVAIDNRGAGKSSNPKSFRDFRLTEMASDYVAVADAVSPDKPVHVLGHDWGSVAMWEAICDPELEHRFSSFTSVSGPSAHHMSKWVRSRFGNPTPKNLALALGQIGSLLYMFGSMTPVIPNVLLKLTMNERRWRTGLSLAEGAPVEDIHLGPTFMSDITRTLRVYRANALPAMLHPQDRHTRVPVQVIVGTRDPAVRQSNYDDELKWNQQTWRRVLDGGHWLPFSHPQVLAAATAELIDAVSGNQPGRGLRRAEMGKSRRPFEDQLVVITGGGNGIGRETALEFARQGAEVVLSDVNLDGANETVSLIEQSGGVAHAYRLNVADEEAVNAHAEEVVKRHGVPDVLVNNAGVGAAGGFLDTPSEEFRRVIEINLFGVVNGSRAFGAKMAERGLGGHIVNLSSMAAYSPQKAFTAYSTSKSAVFMFSDCLRADLAAHNIGVTTICPGVVHTNIVATTKISGVSADEEARMQQAGDRAYAMRRYGPEKVARQIVGAVRKNKQVVPVTPEARLQYLNNRLAPGLTRYFATKAGMTDLIKLVPNKK